MRTWPSMRWPQQSSDASMKNVMPLYMGIIWLVLGLVLLGWPTKAQAIMDGHADWFKRGSWHPIRGMPSWLVRVVGGVVCAGGGLFFYIFLKSS